MNNENLSTYIWSGINSTGKKEKGEIEAASKEEALIQLSSRGITQAKVKPKPEPSLFKPKIKDKDINIFFRQMATMISTGVPLIQCLEMSEKGTDNPLFRKMLRGMKGEIETGRQLGEVLVKYPKYFDKLTCALISAGEAGGILDRVLVRVADYKEKSSTLKGKIKSAMIYPTSIIATAFVVTSVLMIFVIPIFGKMFTSAGKKLPAITQITIDISHYFVDYWYLVLFSPIAFVLLIRFLYKKPRGKYIIDKILLKAPVLGEILKKAAIARFCRTFSTLLGAGISIIEALDPVADTAGNAVIEKTIKDSKENIKEGRSLTEPLANSGLFPTMVTQMIEIGEQTGAMEETLNKIADFYDQEVNQAVENMTSLMEPLIMVVLGVVIGGLVISMYLPIFKMAAAMGG